MSPADPLRKALAGFMLGAAGMFATMYSTQAILPELSRNFDVSPARAGLSISVVVIAVAIGGFVWGPISDRIGRPRAIRTASLLLVIPTIGVALAPSFEALLVCRTLQGLCMPGLLAVGAPYVVEAFVPRIGARAMGYYVSALVAGGLVGRLGVALATAVVGWRVAIGLLAILPLTAAVVMRRGVPEPNLPPHGGGWGRP
ncbi:MAG: MFS transporter, partial [Thermoleophilia bacterium]|nr:MFS transporter [Thermoleophilia bacterium]